MAAYRWLDQYDDDEPMPDRVLLGSMTTDQTGEMAQHLRDEGYDVVLAGDHGLDGVVHGAVQEDPDIIRLTVDSDDIDHVQQYLSAELERYEADDTTVVLEADMPDPARVAAWQSVDYVGETTAGILVDAGITPENATYNDVEAALTEHYGQQRRTDEAERIARARVQLMKHFNEDLF